MIFYVTMENCVKTVFPYIHRRLAFEEQAPEYQFDVEGMAELEKVLELVRNDEYYSSFHAKAAYLICSIAGSQYFSNGNKRLAIVVLMMFLLLNMTQIAELSREQFRDLLSELFPLHTWDDNRSIEESYPLFLYNLAIIIGDRHVWPIQNFDNLKQSVQTLFEILHKVA